MAYMAKREGVLKPFLTVMFSMVLVLMMAGCSSTPNDDRIEVYNSSAAEQTEDYADVGGYDMQDMSNGAVEVYSLEGDAAETALLPSSLPAAMPERHSVPAHDPNVEIFPFDGGESPYPLHEPRDYAAPVMPMSPEEQGEPLPVMPAEDAVLTPLPRTVYFAHNSADLNGAAEATIDEVVKTHNGMQALSVEGHASSRAVAKDPVERKIVNLKMSMERAFRVSSELMRKGVPAETIRATAWGDTRPGDVPEGMSTEEAERRVDIYTDAP